MIQKCKQSISEFFVKYKHFWLLSYFIIYLAWFAFVEKTVTTHFHVIHMAIDDYIPFCEYFVIPYFLWFGYVAWGFLFFGFKDRSEFYKTCAFLFTGMTVFLIISTVYPNGHFLRPAYFTRHNFFTNLVDMLYATDTATNLFPSIHVYNSIGVHLAVVNSKCIKNHKLAKRISFVLAASIVLATMFLKQHSVFDVITAFLLAILMNAIVYKKNWFKAPAASSAKIKSKNKNRLPQI